MTRRRKLLWISITLAALVIASAAAGARILLPSWLRARIERAGGEILGRKVKIAGAFDLSLSLAPTVVAEEVTLANAPWGSEPVMVRIARLRLSVDLPSLLAPPVRIKELEVDGVRILMETGATGRGNWEFERRLPPAPPQGMEAPAPLFVIFDHASIRDFELILRPRGGLPPLRFGITHVEAALDPASAMVDLDAAGHFNDAPWEIAGQLGPLEHLVRFRDVQHALTGRIGGANVTLRGRIRDPLALGDPNLEAEIDSPDIAAALAVFGLRSPLTGPFRVKGRFSPSKEGVDFDLTAGLSGVTAAARGRVGALLKPEAMEARLEVSGPDAGTLGRWAGIQGVPPRPFQIAGSLRRDGPRVRLDDVKGRVGGISMALEGPLGGLPRCVGADLNVTLSGPDLSELSALTRLRLPTGEFAVRARLLRRADALVLHTLDLRVKDLAVRSAGTLGEPPRLESLDLTVDASGPDLSALSGIAAVALPRESFALRGRVARRGASFALDGIEGRLGDSTLSASGSVEPAPRLEGTDLQARVAGPDLGRAASLVGLHGLPAVAYDVSGRVRFEAGGTQLTGVEAHAGRLAARVDGRLGPRPAEDGTELHCSAGGPALSDLAAWGAPAGLPAEPFTVSGGLRIDGRLLRLDHVAAKILDDRATLNGTLGPLPDLPALDMEVEGSGPRLADLGRFLATSGRKPPVHLPGDAYAFTARVRRVPGGFELRESRVTVGNAEIRLDGLIGSGEELRGTDLRFEAMAPDSAIAAGLAGGPLPPGPLHLQGRLARVGPGLQLDGVVASIGEVHGEISGLLGDPPSLSGTDIEARISGPDLASALGPVTGLSPLPAESFEASAHIAGDARRFASSRFTAALGGNDLEGTFSARLEGRPFVEADLRSRHLDISHLLAGFVGEPAATPASPVPEKRRSRKGQRLIPEQEMDLSALGSLDARIQLTAAEVALLGTSLRDVVFQGELQDGALRVNRMEGSGEQGGRATASLSLEPLGVGYRLRASGGLQGGRISPSAVKEEAGQAPSIDTDFQVEGTGRSLHDIAASSTGRALIALGPGRISSSLGGFMTSGIVGGLLDALNPFRKSSPYTELECAVAAAGIENGKASVEPIAARTDKLTIIGSGKIDFETEDINLVWTLKPRKGVGITASSIANPYIKLGGTLSSPSIQAKPLEAVASTGAAVVTGGLTILFRGVYDRVTAEKKVCLKALEKARE